MIAIRRLAGSTGRRWLAGSIAVGRRPAAPWAPSRVVASPTTIVTTARPVDVALRRLSRSANRGRLWFAIGAVGLLFPGRIRRAAIRGAGSLAVTSLVVNTVLKPATRRRRPLLDRTPVVRQLRREPRTTSFPSGHAASAAAFAAGAALERPASVLVLAPLAAAVGYSRVHVGVHYASDVVAGAAFGAGVAMASRYWWPAAEPGPVLRERTSAPALPGGAGLVVVVNPKAGNGDDPGESIRTRLPAAELLELDLAADPPVELAAELADRIHTARALGVAGGDGTVAAVAAAALRHGLPLAVFPAGTLNHFARDAGIRSVEDTARAVEAGDALAVEVATVNQVPFVNTAVIGAYPELVRRRDALTEATGRWLATAIAAGQVLRRQRTLHLTIDGKPVRVWTLFVGNCRYVSSPNAFPATRPRLNDGLLDVAYLRADTPFSRARAVLASLAWVGERRHAYPRRLVTELAVESLDGPVQIARDGEPGERTSTLRFAKLPDRLVVYRTDGG
jgi:undecaprenyl-diphosphatase